MAAIDSAYHYYLSTYGNSVSRYDTHKKSELRKVYNQIVKANKNLLCIKSQIPGMSKKPLLISRSAHVPFRMSLRLFLMTAAELKASSRKKLPSPPMRMW